MITATATFLWPDLIHRHLPAVLCQHRRFVNMLLHAGASSAIRDGHHAWLQAHSAGSASLHLEISLPISMAKLIAKDWTYVEQALE